MNARAHDLHPDFYIDPVIRTREQRVNLVEDGTSFSDVAVKATQEYLEFDDWDEPFFVCDLGIVLSQFKRWMKELPNVQPFYAMKANPFTPAIRTLAALGCGFDCASKNEINHVLSCGVQPERIVMANTFKMTSHICHLKSNDVKKMTFDNEGELLKIHRLFPKARLIIRLHMKDSPGGVGNFASKFGATIAESKRLILKAKELNMEIVGVSYHVGSGNPEADSFRRANAKARLLFDFARTCGFDFKLLDIGGGFPGTQDDDDLLSFEKVAAVIRDSLEEHFPPSSGVKIIAEPGRFFPGRAINLVTNVYAKKKTSDGISYVTNDGIYNSFIMGPSLNATHHPRSLKEENHMTPTYASTIFGPTCDGRDQIRTNDKLPEMQVGDWIIWKDMGCYSAMISIGFNGFQTCKAKFFVSHENWTEMNRLCEFPTLLPNLRELNIKTSTVNI